MGTITLFFGFLLKVAEKIGINIIADKIKKTAPSLNIKFNKKKKYLKALESTIKKMPFLYRDDDADVVKDFVDINIQNVHIENLQLVGTTQKSVNSSDVSRYKLKEETKILIIGNAGIGKTTLLRHTALNLINGKTTPYFSIGNEESFLPIFISLKAIRNTRKSPILHHILETYPLFHGDKGLKTFIRYASNRRIFLFLDGYDEISFVSKENYIQSELAFLLSTVLWTENSSWLLQGDMKYIYDKLRPCRVWLSTREEFYRINPLIEDGDERRKYFNSVFNTSFTALKISGLGENRVKFVKRIFDNYRAKDRIFEDLLDEEQFIEDVDTSNDDTLIDLSRAPLYLTIMAYLYVNRIENSKSVITHWLAGFEQLVKECINVMLVDLDKYKVRNLTSAQREAFKRRRNSFEAEKKEFLNYFSLCLLIDNMNVFDENYIKEKSIDFFTKRQDEINSINILNEYKNPKSNNANFYTQLLLSGIFTVVGIEKNNSLYDFPHRRFKEVLALESLSRNENFMHLKRNLTRKHLSEFVLLVLNSRHAKEVEIIDSLLNELHTEENEYVNRLLSSYLQNLPNVPSLLSRKLEEFVLNSLQIIESTLFVSKIVFEKIPLSLSTANRVIELCKETDNHMRFRFGAEVVREIDKESFDSFMIQQLRAVLKEDYINKKNQVVLSLSLNEALAGREDYIKVLNNLHYFNKYYYDQFVNIDIKIEQTTNRRADLSIKLVLKLLIALRVSNKHFSEEFLKNAITFLRLEDKILLFAFLGQLNPTRFNSLQTVSDYYYYFEVLRVLTKSSTYQNFRDTHIFSVITGENSSRSDHVLAKQLRELSGLDYSEILREISKIEAGEYEHLKTSIY